MARSRMIPTNLFDDPSFFERCSDTQVVLLGLVLLADDYGRGLVHLKLLARKFDKAEQVIEHALRELEACQLVQCYEVEQQRYYHLCRWQEWQKLNKRTPSKYPAPPTEAQEQATGEATAPGISEGTPTPPDFSGENGEMSGKEIFPPTFPGESQKGLLEVEGEGEEEQGHEDEHEGEGEGHQPSSNKVITFPGIGGIGTTREKTAEEMEALCALTWQLARILKLPATEGLQRLAAEYQDDPHLSLLGQADAAREWVDSPERKGQQMSLAFFRRWVSREQEDALARKIQHEQHHANGTTGPQQTAPPRTRKSLMGLAAQYQQEANTGKEISHG